MGKDAFEKADAQDHADIHDSAVNAGGGALMVRRCEGHDKMVV